MDQNSSTLSFFIRNSSTFLFKTQEIMENSIFRKNKFPDLPEKVRNDEPEVSTYDTYVNYKLHCIATGSN